MSARLVLFLFGFKRTHVRYPARNPRVEDIVCFFSFSEPPKITSGNLEIRLSLFPRALRALPNASRCPLHSLRAWRAPPRLSPTSLPLPPSSASSSNKKGAEDDIVSSKSKTKIRRNYWVRVQNESWVCPAVARWLACGKRGVSGAARAQSLRRRQGACGAGRVDLWVICIEPNDQHRRNPAL